jgi:hypothetical protein
MLPPTPRCMQTSFATLEEGPKTAEECPMTAYKDQGSTHDALWIATIMAISPACVLPAPAILISRSEQYNGLAACRVQLAQRIRYVTVCK